eukprot:3280554-Pyramimonas_sp.AAC.2
MESSRSLAHAWVLQGAVAGSLEVPRAMPPRYFEVGPMLSQREEADSARDSAQPDPYGVMEWIEAVDASDP